MKSSSMTATFVGAVLWLTVATLAAQPLTAAGRLEVARAADGAAKPSLNTLERKQRLVELQLRQSPTALRVRQSGHALANKTLAEAQANYAKAQAESQAGRLQVASQLLDESLRQIIAASKLVPDAVHQASLEHKQNGELREALRTFQALHKGLAGRTEIKKAQTLDLSADIASIDSMAVKADALIASGNDHEANVVLNSAYKQVVSILNNMLAAETIVYGLKFDSPTEEFRHELARNRSYEELIPIALTQLNTTGELATQSERHVQSSRNLRDAADKQAGTGNYPIALKTIQNATDHLQRALRIAGVIVPQASEFKP